MVTKLFQQLNFGVEEMFLHEITKLWIRALLSKICQRQEMFIALQTIENKLSGYCIFQKTELNPFVDVLYKAVVLGTIPPSKFC